MLIKRWLRKFKVLYLQVFHFENQMAIALTLMRQRNAVSAQRAVTDTTNDLLTQNAAMLKQNAIETATENERGIVDIETLKTTQSDIIETIEQTLKSNKMVVKT